MRLAFAFGASLKVSAWVVVAGILCCEIETIYEAKKRADKPTDEQNNK